MGRYSYTSFSIDYFITMVNTSLVVTDFDVEVGWRH
jgi:hypothetical protein